MKKGIRNTRELTRMITTLGILTALCVVISLFLTIHTQTMKITLTFIPIALAARLYGPAGGGIVAGLADIIEVLVHPVGTWFPPITLTGIAVGVFFGFLFRHKADILRIIIAALVSELVVSLLITTLWLHILYGSPYHVLLIGRVVQILIMTGIKIAVLPPLFRIADRLTRTRAHA